MPQGIMLTYSEINTGCRWGGGEGEVGPVSNLGTGH